MSKAQPDKPTSAISNDPAPSNPPTPAVDGALEDSQLDSVSGGIVVVGTRGVRPGTRTAINAGMGTPPDDQIGWGVPPDDNKAGWGAPPDDGKTL